jgi:hypothetical protein
MKPKLSTRQAAAAAGIGLSTLNVWIATGKVKPPNPVLVGALGMRLWDEAAVARIMATKAKIYRKGRGRKKQTKG